MPTSQAAPNITALNAVTALSNPNGLLIHSQWDHHSLQCLSTQYSFVEAACTTAGCQTGGVTNVTTLDSAPVGQAPPSSSIPIPLPCPSNGMLPSNPNMSSLPTPCTIESPALSPSQRCGDLLRRPQSSSIPTTPAAFSSTRSTVYCCWIQQYQNLQRWSVAHCELQNSSVMLSLYVGASVVQSPPVTSVMARGTWYCLSRPPIPSTSPWIWCTWQPSLPTMKHVSYPLLNAPDGFDAVPVQNVGSTYMIVSWDLPTDSNGILINFSLYCNGALAGVLSLTVISYNTTGLLPFTLYMYMSSSHAHRHCTPVGMGVISAAASLPSHVHVHQQGHLWQNYTYHSSSLY
ncbi:hypothetical protein EMCRGX_G004629 [Ephydatia muelleri]